MLETPYVVHYLRLDCLLRLSSSYNNLNLWWRWLLGTLAPLGTESELLCILDFFHFFFSSLTFEASSGRSGRSCFTNNIKNCFTNNINHASVCSSSNKSISKRLFPFYNNLWWCRRSWELKVISCIESIIRKYYTFPSFTYNLTNTSTGPVSSSSYCFRHFCPRGPKILLFGGLFFI